MLARLKPHFSRLAAAVLIMAVLAMALPQPAYAAPAAGAETDDGISFDIIAVKADESVTIRTKNFPANVDFTVRMDVAGNMAIDGIAVADVNSGKGGTFEATYKIPAEIKGTKTIAIRLESSRGYYAYNWFNNRTQNNTNTGSTNTGKTTVGPYLAILSVKKDQSVTVEARGLPLNTSFKVRVGPFYTFAREYVVTQTVNTGGSSTIVFDVTLPDNVKGDDLIAIRIDGGGRFAYNAFKNTDAEYSSPSSSGSSSTSTNKPSGYSCSIISAGPAGSVTPVKSHFDATWEIKNTGTKTWEVTEVDYKFVSGTKMQAKADRFDLGKTVKPGETVKIIVDMIAPDTAGYYSANWALVQGESTICSFSTSVRTK